MNFENAHIKEIETFARSELIRIINEKCQQFNLIFKEDEKKYFFGIYDADSTKFRFVGGDISIITQVVAFVKMKVNEIGAAYFLQSNRGKIMAPDTLQLSIGQFFARREKTLDVVVSQSGVRTINEEDMKMDLFNKKVKPLLEAVPKSVKLIRPISEDIVKIVKGDGKVRADVLCVFCSEVKQQMVIIQCNAPKNSSVCYWNTSNLKKHIALHLKLDEKEAVQPKGTNKKLRAKKGANDSFPDDDNMTDVETLLILANQAEQRENIAKKPAKRHHEKSIKEATVDTKHVRTEENKTNENKVSADSHNSHASIIMKTLLEQMSTQNLKNMSSVRKHSEKSEVMTFTINSKEEAVDVVNIKPDGSCFFGTVAHQLYGCQINSEDHRQKTQLLRDEAVMYIKANFDRFRFDLQGRVHEHTAGMYTKEELERECRVFLNACLPRSSCFAGFESIKAISEIEKVNIITISEKGECYLVVDFNEEYERIVFLALRLTENVAEYSSTHNTNRNHYDSISKIDHKVLYTISENCTARCISKHLNNDSIVSLNSTME